jgi:hypothetical protein
MDCIGTLMIPTWMAMRRGYSNEWQYYKNKIIQGDRWARGWS